MSKICYVRRRFGADSKDIIEKANLICREYQRMGYGLTLRQAYYQFVSRGWIENKDTEYKRLGSIINDARLAGELDWDYIVDRTRNLVANSHWDEPGDIIDSAARSFQIDKWADQEYRVEGWVEKEALAEVLERACRPLDIAFFCCRGYTSQSEMQTAGVRLKEYAENGQTPVIIHLGDHDPSGIDMSRDIEERLKLFMTDGDFEWMQEDPDYEDDYWSKKHAEEDRLPLIFRRIALNMDQIRQYSPPPNPAKLTDSRGTGYVRKFGDQSWELDALPPNVLNRLITDAVREYRDEEKWTAAVEKQTEQRHFLTQAAARWETLVEYMKDCPE